MDDPQVEEPPPSPPSNSGGFLNWWENLLKSFRR